ncbi:MAG: hypothetical protein ISS69_13100 [Phycisphaerae bacterium]|nr:hypothetical protein [Phycisphaerae bacterium]
MFVLLRGSRRLPCTCCHTWT